MAADCLAVIPARGGSRGIRGKNLVEVGGKPLIEWTIEAALGAAGVDRVVVNTDSEAIAAVAVAAGADVPFMRPAELAADDVHAVHVVLDTLTRLEETGDAVPGVTMMLLPTAPLRRAEDIDLALEKLSARAAPAVIGVYRWNRYVTNLRYMHGDTLVPAVPASRYNVQRQDQDTLYVVNGAIFAARTDALRRSQTFHVDGAVGYVMSSSESLDINDESDLEEARGRLQGSSR